MGGSRKRNSNRDGKVLADEREHEQMPPGQTRCRPKGPKGALRRRARSALILTRALALALTPTTQNGVKTLKRRNQRGT